MSSNPHQRQILFISHALPEDNEFAKWLASRLRNEGYQVWCELDEIHAGEHFWSEIDPIIRNEAAKFIFVASHISVKKKGVRDEWDFARSIEQENNLQNFIIPINLDGVNSNAIIGLTGIAMLYFQNGWASGLKALMRKLQKDGVPRQTENTPLSASHWLINPNSLGGSAIQKEETFYSNWLDFPQLPDTLYVHEFVNKGLAEQQVEFLRSEKRFPVVHHDRFIIAFVDKLPNPAVFVQTTNGLFDSCENKPKVPVEIDTKSILDRTRKSAEFPTTRDGSNFLVQLLRQAFDEFLVGLGLKIYHLSGKRICYFYSRNIVDGSDIVVKSTYQGKPKSKQLTGKYYEDVWHYGISFNPRLRPHPCISFTGHILFTSDGQTVWQDKKKLHSNRRKKGKRMFNADWRDLWLAFLNSLAEDRKAFAVPLTDDEQMWFTTVPILFVSKQGYQDPGDNARLIPLDNYEEDDEEESDDFADEHEEDSVDDKTGINDGIISIEYITDNEK